MRKIELSGGGETPSFVISGADGSELSVIKPLNVKEIDILAYPNITLDGVESVTGSGVNNFDPRNPVIQLATVAVTNNYNDLDNLPDFSGSGVLSVTGDGVNNADPLNPVINLSDVAVSGDYDDLSNKPTIPQDISDLTDNTGLIPVIEAGAGLSLDIEGKVQLGDTDNIQFTPKTEDGDNALLEVNGRFRSEYSVGDIYHSLRNDPSVNGLRHSANSLNQFAQLRNRATLSTAESALTVGNNDSTYNAVVKSETFITIEDSRQARSLISAQAAVGQEQTIILIADEELSNVDGIRVIDTITNKGMVEAADYSANKTDFSYATKKMLNDGLATKAGTSHTHTASNITDFDSAVAANSAVVANTAKVSNATHTGDVTGSTALTIANGVVTESKLSTSVNASLDLADTALQPSAIGATVQGYSSVLAGTTASFTTADETKLDGIEAGAQVNVATNLTYTPSTRLLESSTGTDVTLPLADGTNAGLMSSSDFTKLGGVATNANNYSHPNHSGDVTSVGDGATTIANDAVTNAKAANMAQNTIKGRITTGTGDPEDLTAAQVRTITETETTTQLNTRDTNNRARANHTGTQTASTISDFNEAAQDAVGTILTDTTSIDLIYDDAGNTISAQREALTGDVTAPKNSNTTTIANNAVTLAKFQTIATDSILGRASASTGNIEVLTALPFAYTGDVTRPADSNVTTIANDAVTYAKIQNVSANSVLARSAGTSGDVGEVAIGSSQLFGRGATGDIAPITLGTNLSMSGTTLNASGGGGGGLTAPQIMSLISIRI